MLYNTVYRCNITILIGDVVTKVKSKHSRAGLKKCFQYSISISTTSAAKSLKDFHEKTRSLDLSRVRRHFQKKSDRQTNNFLQKDI